MANILSQDELFKMYKFSHHFNKVIYLISFFTLLIGFYLSEDGTGNGLSQDFYSTWRFVESLKLNFFSTDVKDDRPSVPDPLNSLLKNVS